jgi:putative tryptophan/tyrosine transport system substrate-binding protein
VKRREFIAALGSAAAWPLAVQAQQTVKIARVGWLGPSLDNPVQAVGRQVLLSGSGKLGFTEGQNLVLEHRPTDEGVVKAFAGANEFGCSPSGCAGCR